MVTAKKVNIPLTSYPTIEKKLLQVTLCISFVLMLCIPPIFYERMTWVELVRSDIVNRVDAFIKSNSQQAGSMDLRSANNRLSTNALKMIVKMEKPQDIYLKDFSAGNYQDNTWSIIDYQGYNFSWANIYRWIDTTHFINAASDTQQTINIQDKRVDRMYAPAPYYYAYGDVNVVYDSYFKAMDKPYEYRVWNQDIVQHFNESMPNEAYLRFVKERYVQIPDEVKKAFDSLNLSENLKNPSSVEDAYREIKRYLDETAVYTLSPGSTPKEKDFVSYFLKENKKGYCVHFASTATLLFRYLGIPARYVEGHRIEKSQFNQEGVANVTDHDAHAWVELFNQDVGWEPYEVTPASTKPIVKPDDVQKPQTDENIQGDQQEQTPTQNQTNNQTQQENKNPKPKTMNVNLAIIVPLLILLFAFLLLMLQRSIRYQKALYSMRQSNRKKAVIACDKYLLRWEHFEGYSKSVGQVIDKAYYSPYEINEEEYLMVQSFTEQTKTDLYHKASLLQKFVLMFMKALK